MKEPAAQPQPTSDVANIHLQVFGEEHTFPVPLRLGESTLSDLLPAARELTRQVTEKAVARARAAGKEVSCRAGCGACCRQLVAISVVEAQALAEYVASLPDERQAAVRARFADALRRLEAAGLLDPAEPRGARALLAADVAGRSETVHEVARRYFKQGIACPFLEDESCGVYEHRPLVCREYNVTSPAEQCSRLYEVGVDSLPTPVHMGEALAQTTRRVTRTPLPMIPLVLSLEWYEAGGEVLRRTHDGLDLLQTLMNEVDRDSARAFDQRERTTGG
jgi:Fe-S-cluster containining protein